MNIVSYRGPGMAGGVSTALDRLYKSGGRNQSWWYLDQDQVKSQSRSAVRLHSGEKIPLALCDAHYRFCNEFIWPIMHDLSEHAIYKEEDYFLYTRFNAIFAAQIERQQSHDPYFVQDYQLALLPKLLKRQGRDSAIFWHIPWPKSVPQEFVAPIVELAQAMLSAKAIGFHTQEYVDNFNNFVDQYLPFFANSRTFGHVAEVVAAPLGLDLDHWAERNEGQYSSIAEQLESTPYVLSVERADYTKGVVDRLKAIDLLFEQNPELRETITFVQICGRTRAGIKAYDNYWKECQEQIDYLEQKYSTSRWKPVVSISQSLNSDELTYLYKRAAVMLVSPLRDGLNLTAKEFIACQAGERPGILALSKGAGVAEEFSPYAITFEPGDISAMAAATLRCLKMPTTQRRRRFLKLKQSLQANPLQLWCDTFTTALYGHAVAHMELELQEA